MSQKIILLEDDPFQRDTYSEILTEEGYNVKTVSSAEYFFPLYERFDPDLLILDVLLRNSSKSGIDVFRELVESGRLKAKVIVFTSQANRMETVEAVQLGCYSFMEKAQYDRRKFLLEIKNALQLKAKEDEAASLREKLTPAPSLIGESAPMQKVKSLIEKFGRADQANVLIVGETGTGKEIVATSLLYHSPRASSPFITVNMGGLTREVMNSELFGHKKGAFTGAEHDRKGVFEMADGGTLFMDEISNLDLDAQAKILRALQQKEIHPVGDLPRKVDVRLLFATNQDLWQLVGQGRFKEDLFYRLEGCTIVLPPLRERGRDVLLLTQFFFDRFHKQYPVKLEVNLEQLYEPLFEYPWPGNVRELENLCEFLFITRDSISNADMEDELKNRSRRRNRTISSGNDLEGLLETSSHRQSMESFERKFIQHHLEKNRWNRAQTADAIGIERTTLYKKMKKFGLLD